MRFAARCLNTSVALAIFILTVYRAATLSFTVDESTTFVEYVNKGWIGIFHGWFDANNHVLYSILEKFARQWFGMSELALRLPVLLGAGLFLWSLAMLCARIVPGIWFSILSFLIVAGNPVTLDFMVAARGYGLGLGLLAFALLQFVEWIDDSRSWRIATASLALGLAVGANLMYVFAAIAAFSVVTLFLIKRQRFLLIPTAILPAVVTALALWWQPFQNYEADRFYFGTKSIYDSVESLELSLFVHNISWGDPFGNWFMLYDLRWWILPYLVPILWLFVFVWIRKRETQPLAFLMLVFAVACFGMWLAHVWLKVLYPEERTGLSYIFLFLLTWTAATAVWWSANRWTRWLLGFPNLLLALLFLAQFSGQFEPRYFAPWRVNWKMHEIMSELRSGHGKLRVHWIYQSTAEYYRLRWKMPYEPVAREADKFELNNADYFILPLETPEEIAATKMRVLYRDELTGTTLLTVR